MMSKYVSLYDKWKESNKELSDNAHLLEAFSSDYCD